MNAEARAQAVRLRRFGIASLTYVIWVGLALYVDAAGMFHLQFGDVVVTVWQLVAAIVVSKLAFYVLFASGLNRRFRDPSLTVPMILMSLAWAILFAASVGAIRGIAMVPFVICFMFGIFSLTVRQYLACWSFAVVGYAVAVGATLPSDPPASLVKVELMYFVLLAVVLFWVAFFARYVGQLRGKLHTRNDELKQALALVEELAAHDDLTGLYNRRFVMGALAREQQRNARHGTPFAVMLLDLDDFKHVNDTYGHPAGDELLKAFVRRVIEEVRDIDLVGAGRELKDTDTFGRFGGEEFIVILPDTGLAGAKRVAERIRSVVAGAPFETSSGEIGVTVSIGVAQYRRGESLRDILERVDKAVYAAKHAGRDRVAVAPPEPEATPHVVRD